MAVDETGYAALTVDQLGTELERRDLPKSGKKDELIARLLDDDAAQAATDPKAAKEAVDADILDEEAAPPEGEVAAEENALAEEDAALAEETALPDDADLAEEDALADEGAPADEKKPRRGRRRGAAETSTRSAPERPASEQARPAPRDANGAVAVRAQARYVRSAPRKARLVMDHIRGKRVADARAILRHTPRAAATDIAKLLDSAVANAENNFELDPEDLKIGRAFVDEGPTLKRYRPRAQGRATPIHKRTSHMTITLTTNEGTR